MTMMQSVMHITNSLEQSPSWEVNSCSAAREIPRLRQEKVHCRVSKEPVTGPGSSHMSPVLILLPYSSEMNF
jgi:hypothetical protein